MLGLDIASLCIKFNYSSFSRSRDMVHAHQNLDGLRDLTTPLSVMICHPCTTVNLPTKIEFFISNHYDDTKGIQNVKNGVFGGY